ncbi:MAG: hypothetical protein KatS3mg081_1574 [Gemmatimonadales bacterium]|nr:MAG: hypothetical protein KatS3mg081_1574 [Gemmatimonadales bacterium]
MTDRPDQTESTGIVPVAFVQLEAGWSWAHELDGGARVSTHTVPGLLVRVGILERLEVRVGFSGFQSVHTEGQSPGTSGLGDMELGFKYRLWDGHAAIPEMAVVGHLSIPTGAEGLSSERADPSLVLAFSNAISQRISLGYNLGSGWTTVDDGSGRRTALVDVIYTVALGISLNRALGIFVESFGIFGVEEGSADSHSLDGGFTYRFSDNFQLDASAGVGLNRAASDWFVGAGMAVRLPR